MARCCNQNGANGGHKSICPNCKMYLFKLTNRCCNATKQWNVWAESCKCVLGHKSQMITSYFTLQHIPIHHLDKCISQNWFFSLQFDKCICLYYKMYLYKLTNVFLQSAQCICNSACHLLCSAAPFGQSSFHKKSFCVTYFLSNRLFVVHHRVKRWFASKESAQKNSILKWWDFTHV